ncbi:hypothetical protein F946_03139 [Acinetobacter johnsonii ANC 3681]|uniref:Uncharacterized protein n=1 Tax=Acinetobacter johnsonii ANC 3681 TaxID=1217662 RepID=N9CSN9_ACIJO|nr:hypothetical protein [Acinetobacter johnsonii]ENV71460.1 hypothetical protein F946_03139 [Acinetobacter johnsonii ANC 3681]
MNDLNEEQSKIENKTDDIGPRAHEIISSFEKTLNAISIYLAEIKSSEEVEINLLTLDDHYKYLREFCDKEFSMHILSLSTYLNLLDNDDLWSFLSDEFLSLQNRVTSLGEVSFKDFNKLYEYVFEFNSSMKVIKQSMLAIKNSNDLFNKQLQPKINEVAEKVKDLESVRLALEMRSTNQIYSNLATKYEAESNAYYKYFYICLGVSAALTFFSIAYYANENSINWITFVSIKLLILALAITLCSIFLRRASHAKKLQDQAYQTHVEIDAFPIHVRSLKEEDKQELIKELALKYFGKELDQTQNDKIGDLMKDQLSAGTELIKASAELVKAKGSTTSS